MAKPIDSPMPPPREPIAFVCLNREAADRFERVRTKTAWNGPLHGADIIVSAESGRKICRLGKELFGKYGGLVFAMASGIRFQSANETEEIKIKIKAKNVVKFKPGKGLKDAI